MKKTFLDFIIERNKEYADKIRIEEAFREQDIESALKLIDSILKKHIDGLIPLDGFAETEIDGNKCTSKQYIVSPKKDYAKSSLFQFNWLNSENSVDIYSIDFFKDLDAWWNGKGKADLSIYTLGTNIVRFLPIVWTIINSGKYDIEVEDAKKISSNIFKEANEFKYYVGGLTYRVYEGLSKDIIIEAFIAENKIAEQLDNIAEGKGVKKLKKEYADVCDAIKGNDQIADIKLSLEKGKQVTFKDDDLGKEEIDTAKKDPDQIFKEMSKYIALVIKGVQPSLILCGAPGVGKTYRVKKQLKEAGYVEGKNLCTIKGKCTARRLYLALYEFKDKNDIIVIDDADSLVGPKADENCINILKGALDSTTDAEGRLVTYGVAGKILDDEGNEVPKRCYIKSGVITITNYRAGQLDTALRGRSFIQDINFNNADVLDIIKKLLPDIEKGILDPKSKIKAYNYLVKLNEQGSKMELSLRTFVLCAKIFKACDGDNSFTDKDAQSMIEEQMRLQYARGGHKY